MKHLFGDYPIADITLPITQLYAQIDAFSQGKLQTALLNSSARNWAKMIFGGSPSRLQLPLYI
ncbi:hypothetical protein GCM10028818_08560 [Spirosoma horti]